MNFEYTDIQIPGSTFRISPSQIGKFFSAPSIWYKDQVLGEKQFTGNTSTVLGTIVHALAESYAKGEPTSREEVEAFLMSQVKTRSVTDDPLDLDLIREMYPMLSSMLINDYIAQNKPTQVEYQTYAEILPGIHVGGSVDNRTDTFSSKGERVSGTIVDYKNVATAPTGGNNGTIPFDYKIQLLAYAYCDRTQGILTDRLRLVYTVRPTKTLPARLFVVNHMITDDDWELIENTLMLIAETIQVSRSSPELTHLLFKSMKLKKEN